MQKEALKSLVARGVVRVPDMNPKTQQVSTHEVLYTLRPSWSNVGKYQNALPGGKIEAVDFSNLLSIGQLEDPEYAPSSDEIIAAALKAVERELFDELGLTAVGLFYIDTSKNKSGWTTLSYAVDLPVKPTLLVKPDSAGTRWVDEERIINGNPRMLLGHLGITRRAIKALEKKNSAS